MHWCRASRELILTERRGRCRAFWLDVSRQRTSDSGQADNEEVNSNADSLTNGVIKQRRRCPVTLLRKRTSDGMWRTKYTYKDCSSTHCFVCYRRELLSISHSTCGSPGIARKFSFKLYVIVTANII